MAEKYERKLKCELYNDSFQNFKRYAIPHAQMIICDPPYCIGDAFYGSQNSWYIGGDNKNGESEKAHRAAFYNDENFNLFEFLHFSSQMVKKEPKRGGARGESSDAPCMLMFCSFEQQATMIQAASKHGFVNYIPLVFIKNYSPQVLKANMRVVGATEYALLFYKSKLPKFRNGLQHDENGNKIPGTGKMVFNWFEWGKDGKDIPSIHPTQKNVCLLKRLIEIFTDPGDVVIDPCAGSGSTGRACIETGRQFFGFEVNKKFYRLAKEQMLNIDYTPQEDKIEGQLTLADMLGGDADNGNMERTPG